MKVGELVFTNIEIWDKQNPYTLNQDFTIHFKNWLKEEDVKVCKLNDQEYISKISQADVIKWDMAGDNHIVVIGVFLDDKKK